MLHFITAAPLFVAREIMALAHGWAEDAPWEAPAWAESVIHVRDTDAPAVLHALREWRIEGRKPARVAIADPTFALAAQAIEREGGFGSSAPAAMYAR